jgi:tetratricopeptide (TPR) repeat protein
MKAIVVTLCACALLLAAGSPLAGTEEAMTAYRALDFDKAAGLFEEAIASDQDNADLHAWLALTLWRQNDPEGAEARALEALEIDPDNTFAHTILGKVYNPQHISVEGADAGKAWKHLRQAVELDPANGDAWCMVWSEALRRGDTEMERRSLESFVQTEFFTPCVFNYARWMLEQLPQNALLLTNGDLDTYPTVALQTVEGIRPDVAVVNLSLLNLSWYIDLVCERYGIPEPVENTESLGPLWREGARILVNQQVAEAWREMATGGEFPRPIAVAVTVSLDRVWWTDEPEYTFQGPFFLLGHDGGVDIERVRQSLAAADALDFGGPTLNPRDTSPLRDGAGVLTNVTAAALQLTQAYLDADRPQDAYQSALWAERFEGKTRANRLADVEKFKETAKRAMDEKSAD